MANGGGQKAKAVILVIVILIAIGFIVKQLMPKRYTYTETLVDVETKRIFQKEFVFGREPEFPVESPYSSGKNAYPVFQCTKCGTVFAFAPPVPRGKEEEVMMGPPGATVQKCPKCGSIEITLPRIPEGQKFVEVDQENIPIVRGHR